MKRCFSLLSLLLAGILTAAAGEVEIKNDNGFDFNYPARGSKGYWTANRGMMKSRPGGRIEKAPDGISGTCMKITNENAGSYSAAYSYRKEAVDPLNDSFTVSVHARGTGKLQLQIYCYSKEGKYLDCRSSKPFDLKSASWEKKTFLFNKYPAECEKILFAFSVKGKAELYLDDFHCIRKSASLK